ncbi:MAG: adenylate/guanylate cyclase domain-containing protein [Alphaproteobacteria bacterium]|nr:adenylate/guanylate cyclase domain-containing protein [Alphaproteobacteria bacterium]MBF0393317.1 adenylate/guanylate cyclase domain-containing protein [Alphaproteobacteria bacterium]
MSGQRASLAIMFADVRGSTRIYEKFGDAKGREITAWSVNTFCDEVKAAKGKVIKTMGDGAMAVFRDAASALAAAVACQTKHANQPVTTGIGFHFGPVVVENNDVFGDAVNVAARLCSLAKAAEILTTDETVQKLPEEARATTRHIDTTTVKGKRENVKIYQVLWDDEEEATVTIVAGAKPAGPRRRQELLLRHGGQEARLDDKCESFTFGRQNADMLVVDTVISRIHAKIEWRRGKFILSDQSTNGTQVLFQHGAHTTLRREEMELTDSGWIGLGRSAGDDNPHRIAFEVVVETR